MYKLYIWYPWDFGKWIYKGEFATKKRYKRTDYKQKRNYIQNN